MKKVLPFQHHDHFSSLGIAQILSIMCTCEEYMPWVYTHFLYNYAFVLDEYDRDNLYFGYYDFCGYTDVNKIQDIMCINGYPTDILDRNISFYIRYFIDNGRYIVILADEYYLSQCALSGTKHFLHEILIYGYDFNRGIVYASGIDNTGHYALLEHPITEIQEAFTQGLSCYTHSNQRWVDQNRIITLEPPPKDIMYPFMPKKFRKKLIHYQDGIFDEEELYLQGLNTVGTVYMGMKYYDFLIERLIEPINLYRHVHHLLEHKRLLLSKMEYMSKIGIIRKDYVAECKDYLVTTLQRCMFLILKNDMKATNDCRNVNNKVRNLLSQVRDYEYTLVEKVILAL